jgi:hypothetical protein
MSYRSALAIAWLLAAGCAAPTRDGLGATGGSPARVSLQDHRTGGRLTLVNDAHLEHTGVTGANAAERRAAYYSTTRRDAATKVTTDEVMDALLDHFDQEGFGSAALAGPAPPGDAAVSQSLEVVVDGQARHMLGRRGMALEPARTFRTCREAFVALYNQTYQLQSVETRPGEPVFQSPAPPRGGR